MEPQEEEEEEEEEVALATRLFLRPPVLEPHSRFIRV